jgi:hypothetical protein
MASYGHSRRYVLNVRILLTTLESRTFHPVCSLFADRPLGNMLGRKVGLRTLNEVRQ